MSAPSALPAGGPPPERVPLGWLLLIPLGCLVLGQALLVLTGAVPVSDGALADPDSFMRLVRVLHLHDTGAWFDSRFPRIDPPEGHVLHWTRPLDVLLLAGAWLLQGALGFDQALYLWGVLISPVCLALTVVALAWAAAPVLDRDARLFVCLALLLQPTVLAYSSLGRPDHHSLLLLLFTVLLGLTARLLCEPANRMAAGAAGLVAALALWVSPEALVFTAASLAALGCHWLLGSPGATRKIERYLLVLSLSLALALVVERGPDGLTVIENDRLSIVHLALFATLTLVWMLIAKLTRSFAPLQPTRAAPDDPRAARASGPAARPAVGIAGRAGLAAAGGLATVIAMLLLFPGLRDGPLGHVDPLYARVRLQHIVEIQPLVSRAWLAAGEYAQAARRVLEIVGIALVAVPFLVLLLVRRRGAARRIWAWVALALSSYLALAAYQVRWSDYAELLLVLPFGAFVAWLLGQVTARTSARAAQIWRPLILVGCLFSPILIAQLLPQHAIQTAGETCPIAKLAQVLVHDAGGRSKTILAFADYGPEILYRTPHSVLSIPNHRPQPGFAATYRALTAQDDDRARALLAERGVDWILLCPSAVERNLFTPAGGGDEDLYERLADGPIPPWVRALPVPGDLAASVRLFEVVPDPALASGGRADPRS